MIQGSPHRVREPAQAAALEAALPFRDEVDRLGRWPPEAITSRRVELAFRRPGDYGELSPGRCVVVGVEDTGCGIAPEACPHLFETFFTTRAVGLGTGLGLAAVYATATQSGGGVEVSSNPDVGTRFSMYLPDVAHAAQGAADREGTGQAVGQEVILVAEDEAMLRRLIEAVLRPHEYAVLSGGSGEEALRLLEERGQPVDLLLTDVVMPGINGRQLAEEVTRRYPGTPVLYMSGYTEDLVVRHGISTAEVHFLQKPFTPGVLTRKIREILDQRM